MYSVKSFCLYLIYLFTFFAACFNLLQNHFSTTKNTEGKAMKRLQLKERIYFDLDETSIAEKAEEVARLRNELSQIESEFKVLKKDYTVKINRVQAQIEEIWHCISTKKEHRLLECEAEYDQKTDTISFYYDSELVKSRIAEGDEADKFAPALFE